MICESVSAQKKQMLALETLEKLSNMTMTSVSSTDPIIGKLLLYNKHERIPNQNSP